MLLRSQIVSIHPSCPTPLLTSERYIKMLQRQCRFSIERSLGRTPTYSSSRFTNCHGQIRGERKEPSWPHKGGKTTTCLGSSLKGGCRCAAQLSYSSINFESLALRPKFSLWQTWMDSPKSCISPQAGKKKLIKIVVLLLMSRGLWMNI